MSPFPDNAAVERVGLGLLDLSLPKTEWTHAGHLAAAAWLVRTRNAGLEHDLPGIIRRYNLATGVANTDVGGYHETITQASLAAVRAFLASLPEGTPIHQACNLLLASSHGERDWLLRYWSETRLFSVEARRGWVPPDLADLPFRVEGLDLPAEGAA